MIITFVSQIDVTANFAHLSIQNGYCKPQILHREGSCSYLDAKALRHPLVEKVHPEVEYIPNDVSFDKRGMLLYGTNACGKSTLMKSIGLALIMAQAGCFVPCDQFTYYPYTQLFTRILNNDNLFRGQSSFAVELSELRNILRRADDRSFVLGDELCSGTEYNSALSIVSAGLHTLSTLQCSFVFTSHLHTLPSIPLVAQIPTLDIYHLAVKYHKDTDVLEYIRTLQEGSGPPIYGLEVCKGMSMGQDFMELAREVQLHLQGSEGSFVSLQSSAYHSEIQMDACKVCGKKAEETHHIKEQQEADDECS